MLKWRSRKKVSADDMAIYVANHRIETTDLDYPYVPLLVGAARLADDDVLDPDTLDTEIVVSDDKVVQDPSLQTETYAEESSSLIEDDQTADDAVEWTHWEVDFTENDICLSEKNSTYCELTGLYWIWKHSPCKGVVGLEHYRRMLANADGKPLTSVQIANALADHDCLVAELEYFKFPLIQDYALCHYLDDMRVVWDVLGSQPRKYQRAFQAVMDSNSMHPYNIIIARRRLIDDYCKWLFGVLFEVERRIGPIGDRSPMQQRVFGFLAERLLNVWIVANDLNVGQAPICSPDPHVEGESKKRKNKPDEVEGYPAVEMLTEHLMGEASLSEDDVPFDHGFYVRTYDDVWQAYGDDPEKTREHAMVFGIKEDRMTSPLDANKQHREF